MPSRLIQKFRDKFFVSKLKRSETAKAALEEELKERAPSYDEHKLSLAELADRFAASEIDLSDIPRSAGLSQAEAEKRLQTDGKNLLTPPKPVSNLKLVWRQVSNMFIQLLLWSGVLSLITYFLDTTQVSNLYGFIVLFAVSALMCGFSFHEERKALKVISGFHKLVPPTCTCIREHKELVMAAECLVSGDLVRLQSGVKVPADLRMLKCNGLKLETAAITGESAAIEYHADPVDTGRTGVFDARNVAFNGSFCIDGEGFGVVIRTGDNTMIGKIAKLTNQQKQTATLLQKEINRFVRFIAILSIGMGAVIFSIALGIEAYQANGHLKPAKVLSLFINGFLVVLLANIPEGLPSTVTSQLAIIARRMAKMNVCVKRLDIIETLGAATVIASDKTGTLTMNIMTLTDLWFNNQFTSGSPEIKTRRKARPTSRKVRTYLDFLDDPLPDLLTAMVVCNKANIEIEDGVAIDILPNSAQKKLQSFKSLEEQRIPAAINRSPSVIGKFLIRGSPSEAAMLRYCENLFPSQEIRDQHDIVFEIPFNSSRKWHLVITKDKTADNRGRLTHFTLTMKGAPEILIKMCSKWASDSGIEDLNADFKSDFDDAYLHFGKEGRRVIGFCHTHFDAPGDTLFNSEDKNFPTADLTFLGMAAIMDPPRPDTKRAILACKTAGIKVFMVTGDHPVTAAAIARQIALITPYDTTRQISKMEVEISVDTTETYASEDEYVVHGDQLNGLTNADWDRIIERRFMVFARTTPEQKLLIVENLQKRGEVVAVTGDGVNDSPALKRADIGIAMGQVGSDVAKQAADIVLMDDNFASIVHGIEQGRLMFANLRKTIAYTMTHMPPEIFQTIMNLIFGFPVGLTSLQVLSIDLVSELPPAISLAYETPESDIMLEPPRKKTAKMVNKRLLFYSYILMGLPFAIAAWVSYASVYLYHGIPISKIVYSTDYWVTGAEPLCLNGQHHNFTSLANSTWLPPGCLSDTQQVAIQSQSCAGWHIGIVWGQIFHIWMCKTRKISLFQHGTNLSTILAVLIEIGMIVFFIYVPGVNLILGAAPPPGIVYVSPVVLAVIVWVFNEWRKWFIRNYPSHKLAKGLKW